VCLVRVEVNSCCPSPLPRKTFYHSTDNLIRLLDDERQNDIPTADGVFTDHTLPVTDIVCGVGVFPKCRVLSSSIDHTVKVSACSVVAKMYFVDLLVMGSVFENGFEHIRVPAAH
jgi:hypothetical protein